MANAKESHFLLDNKFDIQGNKILAFASVLIVQQWNIFWSTLLMVLKSSSVVIVMSWIGKTTCQRKKHSFICEGSCAL